VSRILAIGCGGFLGAVLRYWISGWVYSLGFSGFPTGTLVVNVAGSFLLGLVVGLAEHFVLHPHWQPFLTIGLLGAFTTFSTLSFETMALLEVGSYSKALLNVGASVLLGLVAVLAGLVAGRAV
jgi:CrcB protein